MSPLILSCLLISLGLGTSITFASSHWFLAWMGLEINTLAIIPLMAHQHHPRAIEASTKYFLVQATAAAMLLFASITNAWISGQWEIQQIMHPLPFTLITLALALKMGLAPLHAWMPEVLQGLDLTTGLIITTWQKLAPLALMMQIFPTFPNLFIFLGLTSTLVGGWAGLNQTQLRKILAYSSIAHLGWMVIIIQFSPALTLLSFLIYFIMTLSAFLMFKLNSTTTINSLASSWTKAPMVTCLSPLIFLSLGGLPPLSGFMPKWLILTELVKQELGLLATTAALTALLSLYFYLRLSYSTSLTLFPQNLLSFTPWRFKSNQLTLVLSISMTLTISLLPITPAMMALIL